MTTSLRRQATCLKLLSKGTRDTSCLFFQDVTSKVYKKDVQPTLNEMCILDDAIRASFSRVANFLRYAED